MAFLPGGGILVTRERFRGRRRSIQRCHRTFGSGSRGRGKKRRELAIRKLDRREHDWVESRIRQIAAAFIAWCQRHEITDVYIEDLSGIRDEFEKQTEGDAPEQLKRYIHSWSFFETRLAIERQGAEHDIRVHVGKSGSSHRCPSCGDLSAGNVRYVDRPVAWMVYQGRPWKSTERRSVFRCESCGLKAKGDEVTCANMLTDMGRTHALEKRQEKGRRRNTSKIGDLKKKDRRPEDEGPQPSL